MHSKLKHETERDVLGRIRRALFTLQHARRRLLSGVVVGLIIAVLVLGMQWFGFFKSIRTRLIDNFYNPRPTTGIVTIIAVDDTSLGAYGRSTVDWDRTRWTDLVTLLDDAGARVIVFDVLFADPTEDDATLAEAMQTARNVVQPVQGDNKDILTTTAIGDLITYDFYVPPTDILRDASRILGHVNIQPDDDGQVRRVPLVIDYHGELLPALGLATYMQYLNIPIINAVTVEEGLVQFANRDLITDGTGQMMITYFGPPSKIYGAKTYPVYTVVDVLEGRVPPEVFAGQIVLIGALDAAGLPDNYATPITHRGEKMYGVEIHANIIETIHQSLPTVPEIHNNVDLTLDLGVVEIPIYKTTTRLPLHPIPHTHQLINTFLFALLAGMLLPFLRWYVGLVALLLAYGAYFAYASVAFVIWGRTMDLLFPAFALAFAFLGTMITVYMLEERRRTQINDLFSRYVSPEIAQKIVESFDRGELQLGGEEREITVLFADIRGFTALAEGLSPTEVVGLLNVFLEEMNVIVMRYGGAINKYMGDNLMAFWNAPYPQDDHARLAVIAGQEMLSAVLRLNESGRFGAPVQFGIGINTGPVVVGNIGSQRRLEYTPIGDTVNVASRLSGLAPGGTLYIGARTFDLLEGRIKEADTYQLQLKGRQEAVTIYELRPVGVPSQGPAHDPAAAPAAEVQDVDAETATETDVAAGGSG